MMERVKLLPEMRKKKINQTSLTFVLAEPFYLETNLLIFNTIIQETGLISLSLFHLKVNAFYLVACLSTSAAAADEAQVVEVSAAVLHGGRGVAQLRAAVVFVARHHRDDHAVWHVVAQCHHLTHIVGPSNVTVLLQNVWQIRVDL